MRVNPTRIAALTVWVSFLILAVTLIQGCGPIATPVDYETIWKLESGYVAALKAKDIDALETFYHPEFIGWPSHSETPVDLAGARESLDELMRDLKVISLEMDRNAIRIDNGVALTHYTVALVRELPEGEQSRSEFRITHTWLSTEEGWKILGGMSSS